MISIHSLSIHPVVSLPMFLFIFISEVHDSSYFWIHLSRYSEGLRGPKWSPPWRNILWLVILEECKSVPNVRAYFKAKVLLAVTACQRAWRVLQPLNHEDKGTTEAASGRSPPLHKQRGSRPRRKQKPLCWYTEWRLLTVLLQSLQVSSKAKNPPTRRSPNRSRGHYPEKTILL